MYLKMKKPINDTKLTLSVPEAAEALGIGRSLAYDLARRGELPVIRLGRRLVVARPALEKMLETPQKIKTN
jgi:excisionase family DNA binding protein